MMRVIWDEAWKLARSPRRWPQLFQPRRWRQFLGVLRLDGRGGGRWKAADDARFKQRTYASYEQYLEHQQSKLQFLDLAEYDRNYRRLLQERLAGWEPLTKGAKVLCLGARQGTEVKAFRDLGCTAVGIDLNPGEGNSLVIQGDFHHLPFAAGSLDFVFTNSLDHVFDLGKVMAEIRRVLKPGGWFIVEAIRGEAEAGGPDHYASFWWQTTGDLVSLLEGHHFKCLRRLAFEQPWPGEQLYLRIES